ncbi:DUF4214 domain-containing protein [Duganella sp. sic0402]|uniref:DUF4214 domain-containing protein n=1 Tax=Duganella sp. sic0402 TaxID=2854786 RepID=UPI001C47E676|nr:DUF4214 domain-containing protein [Duganella sp. sic0402]
MKHQLKWSALTVSALLAACGSSEPPTAVSTSQKVQGGAPVAQAQEQLPAERLGPALNVGQVRDLEQLRAAGRDGRARQGAAGPGLQVDVQDREAVRVFFNGIYAGIPEAPMNWTGSYASGAAGTVSKAYQDSTLLRINWFRAMAGLSSNTVLVDEYNAKDQQAAMIMSTNGQLSHYPPATWKNYTADGYDGASHSNLALYAGVQAVDSYINDFGDSNFPVGHRRWLLYPQNSHFGSGSVPGGTYNGVTYWPANALWTVSSDFGTARPKVRDDYVAWPPRGYVPYQVTYKRWSISYPDADFKQAKVVVTLNGANVPLTQEEVHDGYGENTLVWKITNIPEYGLMGKPATDQRYSVTVSNVLVQGKPVTYAYDVTVFDPAKPTAGAARTTVLPPATVALGAQAQLAVQSMLNATGYQLKQYQRRALDETPYNAGNAAGVWVPKTTGSYNSLAGPGFFLRHGDFNDQTLTLAKKLLAGSKAAMTFTRSTYYLAPQESLHVQISDDDGASWNSVYSETGFSTPTSASEVKVSLAAYAGRKISVRFLETQNGAISTCDACGWTLSDVSLSDTSELLNEQTFALPASGVLSASWAQAGDYALFGRTQYQSLFYGEWGPVAAMYVDGAKFSGKRANYSVEKKETGYVFTDNVGSDGVQVVRNPFRLDFTDTSLAFDADGNAGTAYLMYQAAFNRKPDLVGLGFWIKRMDAGLTAQELAAGFVNSPEFKRVYGANPTSDELVKAMYRNTLHREPEPAGYRYWLNLLSNGLSTESMLLAFAASQENRQQVAPDISLGIEYIRY